MVLMLGHVRKPSANFRVLLPLLASLPFGVSLLRSSFCALPPPILSPPPRCRRRAALGSADFCRCAADLCRWCAVDFRIWIFGSGKIRVTAFGGSVVAVGFFLMVVLQKTGLENWGRENFGKVF